MKNRFLLIPLLFFTTYVSVAQIKPTIMVIPSNAWMVDNDFTKEIENQGTTEVVYLYEKALREHRDLKKIIDQIGGLWADEGFQLEDLESVLLEIKADAAEDNMRSMKDGSEIAKNPVDVLFEKASPDIKFTLDFSFAEVGWEKKCDFVITAIDAYTNKPIANKQGMGNGDISRTEVELAREMVYNHMSDFVTAVGSHFQKIIACQCREVRIDIKNTDGWGEDLESEFGEDEEELNIIIEEWFEENTTDGGSNIRMVSENKMTCKQVMIPLFYNKVYKSGKVKEKKMDTKKFAQQLQKHLKEYDIEAKVVTKGLGRADIILGSK